MGFAAGREIPDFLYFFILIKDKGGISAVRGIYKSFFSVHIILLKYNFILI